MSSDTRSAFEAVILMGPSGCGKSTTGQALAKKTQWTFIEGDDYHPPLNIKKQAKGQPLDDSNRAAWLDNLIDKTNTVIKTQTAIVACSALTAYVQSRLKSEINGPVRFVLLNVDPRDLHTRLTNRKDHFMPASLLDNQLSDLDAPDEAYSINAAQPVEAVCLNILSALKH